MKKIILILFAFGLFNLANAQIDLSNARDGESVEFCLHHKKMNALKENPAFLQLFQQEQAIFQAAEEQIRQDNSPNRVVYTIPIVFHILHNGGVENITNAQIIDAVEVLNRDYRKLNADTASVVSEFRPIIADVEVQFVLATKAPNGTCFNGITRTQSSQSFSGNGDTQLTAIINGNDVYNGQWSGNKYLNVFVCGDIGGAAGYTMTPSNWVGTNMANGIYILHEYVGRIGTGTIGLDRALTHEIGHWLNLEHTWGGTNNPGVSCGSDGVNDTPETRGVTACLLNENFCGPRANVENYMDYSYCSKMYTEGQKTRMRAALTSNVGGRNNLWTASNLVSTGADGNTSLCESEFYADRTLICSGSTVQFYDNSFNNVTSWNWSFPGAATTSSTSQNPSILYNTPGTYTVTLVAGDGNTTLSKTKTAYIVVQDNGLALPILDGFEPYTSITTSDFWTTYNPQNNGTFQITSNAALTGAKSAYLSNFTQSGANTDELISSSVDLSAITSSSDVTLSFRFSYRKKLSANAEKLFVLMTGNCGETWEIKKSIQGQSLSPSTATTAWVPSSAADWTTVHVTNITSSYWNSNFQFKFRFEGSGGNNLYLDDINIYNSGPSETVVGTQLSKIDESQIINEYSIYPNPADNELNIEYFVGDNAKTEIKVVDLLGKVVMQKSILSISGNNLVVIGTDELASGIYNVNLSVGGTNYIKQVVIK